MRKTERLDKVIANSGYATRSEIKALLKLGAVSVDGSAVRDGGMHIYPFDARIEVNGKRIVHREFTYIMMNKPAGVISATEDRKQKTVLDIIPEEYRRLKLFPAGRLDIDTEGLLILTDNGQLAHEILSPKKHVPKKYFARVAGRVSEQDVEDFEKGVILEDGYKTMPAELTVLSSGENSEIELMLHEGKYHQVKRMFEAAGKNVLFLKRIQMGALKLDQYLKPGECRELSPAEVLMLKQQ